MSFTKQFWCCHQLPERSFFVKGYQFPLCARCTGIACGYCFAFFLIIFNTLLPIWLCSIFLMPLILDGGIQFFANIVSTNTKRALTGFFFGLGIIHFIANILIFLYNTILFKQFSPPLLVSGVFFCPYSPTSPQPISRIEKAINHNGKLQIFA